MNLKCFLITLLLPLATIAQQKDSKIYELRVYYSPQGKLDALVKRFTDHTTKLFEKHGMTNVGYWIPVDNKDNALYYVLSYPDKESRDKSWKAFMSDPVWQEVSKKSEEGGKIVQRVTSTFMTATDFSPAITNSGGSNDRTFELRTYYIHPKRYPEILTRFRNHTVGLLEKHGATNIAYWTTVETGDKEPTLIYILAYPNEEAGKKTWTTFRADPDWIKVKSESEKDHPIVEKVESVIMKPMKVSGIR